jgi:hypothetical protein
MAEKDGKRSWVIVNRAPVLTLWAVVVAEVLGFDHDEALTLGRAVAGLNAYSKGVSPGLDFTNIVNAGSQSLRVKITHPHTIKGNYIETIFPYP